ncbi:prepilin-type N-terminal cleavage/methylation domain-containing protein [Planctomycetota bacterium]|jgi:prepilin-type N-terminal cleavage/methylation domain-containing protein|nr:prepilin-type N-terminal cleavage/methylation domain-containing protein [Planctomycetota bacterium]
MKSTQTTATCGDRGGFTLLEILIALTILALLLSSVGLLASGSKNAFSRGTTVSAMELRTGLTSDVIQRELSLALTGSLSPEIQSGQRVTELTYVRAVGWEGETTITTAPRTLRFELDPAEANNGADDDGDGLIDEGILVLIEDVGLPTERRRILARGLAEYAEGEVFNGVDDNGDGLADESGFAIERMGAALEVTVTLEQRPPGREETIQRTLRSSILLRN